MFLCVCVGGGCLIRDIGGYFYGLVVRRRTEKI
jgi:hypothetical protein